MDRYKRQIALKELGEKGQEKFSISRAVVVGCGGLGSSIASFLVRAGIGSLCVIEGDIVDEHNLHRQLLYTEKDVGRRKAPAALRALREMNNNVVVEAHDTILDHSTTHLLKGADIILDGTDNLPTRFLINDYAVKNWLPWVYGGAVVTEGMTMSFVPGGPCMRCVFPELPPPGSLATCQSAGVLGTLPTLVAAFQATEAMKILAGHNPRPTLLYVNPWEGVWREVELERRVDCPCCSRGEYPFLQARERPLVTTFCQGEKIRIVPSKKGRGLVSVMKSRYAWGVVKNGVFIFSVEGSEMVVEDDGTATITGADRNGAMELYSSYVGW